MVMERLMDDDALQALNYAMQLEQQRQEGYCEHGIHPDGGHPCPQCLADGDQETLKNDPGYIAWLDTLEREHAERELANDHG